MRCGESLHCVQHDAQRAFSAMQVLAELLSRLLAEPVVPRSTPEGQVHPDMGVDSVFHQCMRLGIMQGALCAAGAELCQGHAHHHRCHGTHGRWRSWSLCGARPRLQLPRGMHASLTPSLRQWYSPASAFGKHAIRGSNGAQHCHSLHPSLSPAHIALPEPGWLVLAMGGSPASGCCCINLMSGTKSPRTVSGSLCKAGARSVGLGFLAAQHAGNICSAMCWRVSMSVQEAVLWPSSAVKEAVLMMAHLDGLFAGASHKFPDRVCILPIPPEQSRGVRPAAALQFGT